ncbi:RDD family protein [Mycolicibacterium sp. J2]|uniref:RDD family protein n=1 Tax=Mycolicibacterium sp. J2 TaxID=2993511 RepID=UPI00224B1BD2|nr:RDD family protein [Mycolicibacterium sp. J2]MCX2714732.1 RDD family protein [Mycolicibacterium sp. J2]
MTTGDLGPQPWRPPTPKPAVAGNLGRRFFARVIDGVIVNLASVSAVVALQGLSNILVTGLFSGLLTFVYFVAFEVSVGWTPGKKVLGLEVRGPHGRPHPDLKQSAIRNSFTLLAMIPYLGWLLAVAAYIFIALSIKNSPWRQGAHDDLAGGTQVVKT